MRISLRLESNIPPVEWKEEEFFILEFMEDESYKGWLVKVLTLRVKIVMYYVTPSHR
jgi:hypothetical protein